LTVNLQVTTFLYITNKGFIFIVETFIMHKVIIRKGRVVVTMTLLVLSDTIWTNFILFYLSLKNKARSSKYFVNCSTSQ
jgi:hypothetical protein